MGKVRSPGPAVYGLPPTIGYKNHDVSRLRNPQYTMSPRLGGGFGSNTLGPGPSYMVRGFKENGKESPPAYTLVSRYKPIAPFVGPGPGAYSPESVPRMSEQRPPAYTMSARGHVKNESIGPGPLAYSLPSMMGPKVPNKHVDGAYTMSPRVESHPKSIGPGPAGYGGTNTDTYKNRGPQYSLRPQWNACPDRIGSPGPAAYSLSWVPGRTQPKYSLGRQYNDMYTPYVTPQDTVPCDQ